MKKIHTVFLSIVLLICVGCDAENRQPERITPPPITTIYLIRHAEKDRSDPSNPDPELNQEGLGRAMHWAEILEDVPLDAIYSTDYERTAMTAAPTSVKKDITVQYYDPQTLNVFQFKQEILGKKVLVVGHSNTTPDIVNKLLGKENQFPAMDDSDNGSLFVVHLSGDQSEVSRLHINCNCQK
ncbi:histidine phosphatase family protein [Robiginitalea sp.]|nr:histidine phosphatase family protein [Robiginitalea sp.]